MLSSIAYACSCGEWNYEDIDEIFYGKIVDVSEYFLDDYYDPTNEFSDSVYVIEITKKWKGNSSNRLRVYDVYSCGYGLRNRKTNDVIVYAINYSLLGEFFYHHFDNEQAYKKINSLGRIKLTTDCFYYPTAFEDSTFKRISDHDLEKILDKSFQGTISLRPYYINLFNFILFFCVLLFLGFRYKNSKKINLEDSETPE
ncbi:MAG: hypothetical protein ED557_04350 [Balneola sp.]|nr:MAG: hypothetical protein ED557_04350 [Balneola sp.]